MACDFSVIMNPGPTEQIEAAGEALELVHAIEGWLSIYRESSELSAVNRTAAEVPGAFAGNCSICCKKPWKSTSARMERSIWRLAH